MNATKKKGVLTPKMPPKAKTTPVWPEEKLPTKAAVFLKYDDGFSEPVSSLDGSKPLAANLMTNVDKTFSPLSHSGQIYINLVPGATVRLDCGLDLMTPNGYQAQLMPISNWYSKGVLLTNAGSMIDGRPVVYLTNASRMTYKISHGDQVAEFGLIPSCTIESQRGVE